MPTAKDLFIRPIDSATGNRFVKAHHYSGKVAQNSQLHLGVFWAGRLHGVMQFGPSLDKRKIQGLVSGTQWHEFLELNRMAFDDVLPRNSESRALAIAWRLLRKNAPQVKWVVSFADGTQCGDGTIYRAAGFVLTGIQNNKNLAIYPDGRVVHKMTMQSNPTQKHDWLGGKSYNDFLNGAMSWDKFLEMTGGKAMVGYQLRYIYFLDPTCRARLTVPELPYSEIERRGASMYKGLPISRVRSAESGTPEIQPEGALQCDPDASLML